MSLFTACDALRSATGTLDRVKDAVFADLNQVVALLVGAPLDIFAVVRELTTMPGHVLREVREFRLVLHEAEEHRVRHAHIAERLLAACEHAGLTVRFDLLLKVICPRDGTELMTARQLQCFVFFVLRVKLHVHDGAHAAIFTGKCSVNIFVFLA